MAQVPEWLALAYGPEVTGRMAPADAEQAAALLGSTLDDAWMACAVGELAVLRMATAEDPGWVNRPGGPLALPPLVAVTHCALLRLPGYAPRLRACAEYLLQAGAAADQAIACRAPPASLEQPDEAIRLSALYGAAGVQHDEALTRLLLEAGADPDDGESLYHALEAPAVARLLLAHGARITGTNALFRALDMPGPAALELLLEQGADANERGPSLLYPQPLLWAIRRRQPARAVAALLAAGADAGAVSGDGVAAGVLAHLFGLPEVAALLGGAAPEGAEAFVAACARGDVEAARALQEAGWPAGLPPHLLRMLPELAAAGAGEAVRAMVALGWPVDVRGGDWDASALNHAVFRGDAGLTAFLLEHGADWRVPHGFGGNVAGTLGWASCNMTVAGGDWPACARALLAGGMPAEAMVGMAMSPEVGAVLMGEG